MAGWSSSSSSPFAGQGVAGGAFGELELAHVARKRGLGDVEAFGGEFAAQLVLAGDGGLHQEVADRAVPLRSSKSCAFVLKREKRDAECRHALCINIQLSMYKYS